jgi:hypothetical protein
MIGGVLGGAPTMTLLSLVGDERAEHLFTYLGRGRQATEEMSPRVRRISAVSSPDFENQREADLAAARRLIALTTRPHSDAPSTSN